MSDHQPTFNGTNVIVSPKIWQPAQTFELLVGTALYPTNTVRPSPSAAPNSAFPEYFP
jgi:hypothetical protein